MLWLIVSAELNCHFIKIAVIMMLNFISCSLILFTNVLFSESLIVDECSKINELKDEYFVNLNKKVVHNLEGNHKGDAGKITVVGGSVEYTGAPYFSSITALKVGADIVTVLTVESAAPVIKSYSPDLIVIPHNLINITRILSKSHVVVIGPGLGRSEEAFNLTYDVITICKDLKIPLVIDADGLYAIYKNIDILKDYPNPGVIMTPNVVETRRLQEAIAEKIEPWHRYWGDYVTILEKGETDQFYSSNPKINWSLKNGGSNRRVGGQGDILSGALGTFLNWSLKSNLCENNDSTKLAQSVASYAAAKFTRSCNYRAFEINGRHMIASDMLNEIRFAFDDLF